eukprot:6171960-Pleurochrysis_carterae.AAC.1
MEELMRLLTETPWLASLPEHARPARAQVLALFGLKPPQVDSAARDSVVTRASVAEHESYKELVGEMGY